MGVGLFWTWVFIFGFLIIPDSSAEPPEPSRVLAVAERMKAAFQGVTDYRSEVEQIYYREGGEDRRYRFQYFFKKPDKVRVDFTHPHSGLAVFYRRGEKEATIRPFPSFPLLRGNLSIDNSLIQTPTGQGIHQTDMFFFIGFLFRNLEQVPQKDSQFLEEKDRVIFLFWAQDYVKGELPEKYKIFISTQNWFPIRIERYSPQGQPIEVSIIHNNELNPGLDDLFFLP